MRIYYDGFVYSYQKAGGINRYFSNIISRLPADCTPIVSEYWFTNSDLNFPFHPRLKHLRLKPLRPARLLQKWNRSYFGWQVRREKFDFVHPTYYELIAAQNVGGFNKPVVLTVHDMLHEKFLHTMSPDQAAVPEQKRKAIEAASIILCVSENTRRDLIEHYPVAEERIRVIYHGSELSAADIDETAFVPSYPFFLYVGGRAKYKNFSVALQALHRLQQRKPNLALCVVGPPFSDAENKEIAELKLRDAVIFVGQVKDSQLAKLYRDSLALVYPSLYEGFGIPALEAMACGTIAVAANRSSLPEVVGNAGLLFDPDDPDALYDILHGVAQGTIDRANLIARGKQQALLFNWDTAARQTYEAYQTLIA